MKNACYDILYKDERRGIMDNKDKDLKNALDDIFGSDFIEIDTGKKDGAKEELTYHKKEVFYKDSEIKNDDNKTPFFSDDVMKDDEVKENKDNDNYDESLNIIDSVKEQDEDAPKEKKDNNFLSNKKIIIWFIIGFIIGIILIYVLVNYVFGLEKVVNCSTSAEDIGYKYTDEYKITYKKNKIIYVQSTYTYTALSDEYKDQIDYVKNEKLKAIINSNGMPGFTYSYENSDDYFKVNGYLDFELIDFKSLSGINQESTPLSYFEISKDLTFEKLKSNLEKSGYQCTASK